MSNAPTSDHGSVPSPRPKLDAIQVLRGIAATSVVFFHATSYVVSAGWHANYFEPFMQLGNAGVDIFFAISGFLMVVTTAGRRAGLHTAREFLIARGVRIIPMYWFMTTLMAMLLLVVPAGFNRASFDPLSLFASYTFLPYAGAPIVFTGWTLTYEMWFYLVFSSMLLLPLAFRVPMLIAVLIGCTSLSMLGSDNPLMSVITSTMVLEFAFGAALGWAYLHGIRPTTAVARVLVAAGVLGFVLSLGAILSGTNRVVLFGLPAALLLFGMVNIEGKSNPLLLRLGDSSYSIYLTHVLTFPVVIKAAVKFGVLAAAPGELIALVAIVLALCVGEAAFLLVERPLDRSLRRFLKRRSSHRASAAAPPDALSPE